MEDCSLTARGFARFYAPLAATSLLLTATNPVLTAALARAQQPTTALAGFSVAFALTGLLYSPLLAVQQVAAARVLLRRELGPLRRYSLALGALLSALAAVIAFSQAGTWTFGEFIGLSGGVHDEAREAMALLWPVPFLTALRALSQGRLVAHHHTRPIAFATGVRTGVLALVAFLLATVGAGAWLGSAAFTAGLLVEALLLTGSDGPSDRDLPAVARAAQEEDRLLLFSTPLMLNVMLWWGTPLLINSVLARTAEPDLSLAAFAVVEATAWFLAAPVGQLQHASIALVDGVESHRRVRLWAGALALGVFLLLAAASLPVPREAVLRAGFDLDPVLLARAGHALPLATLYPLLYAHRQYFQGLFVRAGRPGVVGWGALLRVAVIALAAWPLLGLLGANGALLGVALAVTGLLVEGIYLERRSHSCALPLLASAPPALSPEAAAP